MENISKALLIVAAILMFVLIMSAIMVSYNAMSDFYEQEHKNTKIEQIQEFNDRFQNYNDNKLRGNELLSLMNRVIDYNNLQSNMKDFERIVINIDFLGHVDELSYDGNPTKFTNIIVNDLNDNEIKEISELSAELTSAASGIPEITDLKLQKLASEIYNIVPDNVDESTRAEKLTKILGYKVEPNGYCPKYNTNILREIQIATYEYYELTQFKRAMFTCTDVFYDEDTGRVNGMSFVVQTEKGIIKFE